MDWLFFFFYQGTYHKMVANMDTKVITEDPQDDRCLRSNLVGVVSAFFEVQVIVNFNPLNARA